MEGSALAYHGHRSAITISKGESNGLVICGGLAGLPDGAADVKPIAHLYKSQVYGWRSTWASRKEIRSRPPDDGHLFPASVAGGLLAAVRSNGLVLVR